MLAPFALMVSTAFKEHAYVLEIPPRLIPERPTIDNFVQALATNDFGRYFLNSVFVATLSTILSVTLRRCWPSCSPATSSRAGVCCSARCCSRSWSRASCS